MVRRRNEENEGVWCVIFLISVIQQKLLMLWRYVYPPERGLRLHHRKKSSGSKSYLTRNNLMCDYKAASLTGAWLALCFGTTPLCFFVCVFCHSVLFRSRFSCRFVIKDWLAEPCKGSELLLCVCYTLHQSLQIQGFHSGIWSHYYAFCCWSVLVCWVCNLNGSVSFRVVTGGVWFDSYQLICFHFPVLAMLAVWLKCQTYAGTKC